MTPRVRWRESLGQFVSDGAYLGCVLTVAPSDVDWIAHVTIVPYRRWSTRAPSERAAKAAAVKLARALAGGGR